MDPDWRHGAVARIAQEVSSWVGVAVEGHAGGMMFFHVGRREIGHVHGVRFADLPFPVRIREQLVGEGRAQLHYLHPKSGWVTCPLRTEADAATILELFRLNYARPWLGQGIHRGLDQAQLPGTSGSDAG
jgi:hypothetical protein